MRTYDIEFTVDELNKFNLVESDTMRISLMSVYRYLLKLNLKENAKLKEANLENLKEDPNKLKISYRRFLAAYNHRGIVKISIRTLKNRIDKLIELKLISVEEIKNTYQYSFCRYKVIKNVNSFDCPQTLEKSNVNNNSINPKSTIFLNPIGFKKDLDSYKSQDNFDYEGYLSQNKKCTWDDIISVLPRIFSLLKIRSRWIKGQVVSKLYDYSEKITKKHMVKYICSVIINARSDYYKSYNKYCQNQNENGQWNNYNQRTYDFDDLEMKLLGWKINY